MVVSIAMIIMIGYTNPLTSRMENRTLMFNECSVVIHLYHSLCFTDFQPDIAIREYTGLSLIAVTIGNILINLGLVSWVSLEIYARKAKLSYLGLKARIKIKKNLKEKQEKLELEEIKRMEAIRKLSLIHI